MVRNPGWLLLLACAALPAGPEEEWERPWEGLLPDPGQDLGNDDRAGSEWMSTRFLDAATGRPVPGARLVRTPEWIDEFRLRHDMVMSVGVADAEGIARVPALGYLHRGDSHWMALAPGYAPTEDYAPTPDAEMLLHRGIPMSFRILDPLGRPVAGAVVEYLDGCSHGTAGARAVAGEDGVATFPHLRPGYGQFWIAGPGIASDLRPVPDDDSLGTRPEDIVMEFGRRFEGRVTDPLGEPVPACVVRVYQEQRGPTAITGRDGRFVLEGADNDALHFFPAVDLLQDASERTVDDVHPGVPFTVTLTSVGVAREKESARVVVRARDAEGKPVPDVEFRLVGATGRGPSGSTEDEESEEDEGVGVVPGSYRVLPDDPFARFDFAPATAAAEKGHRTVVVLALRPRARLKVEGEVPEGADLVLAIEGDETDVDLDDEDGLPGLPAEGAAALRVEVDDRPPFFFPVGPVKDGVRTATVALPAPRRIPVPPGARDADLFHGTRRVLSFGVKGQEDVLLTDATGPLVLRFKDAEGRTREVPAGAPGAAPRTVVREVRIRALGKDEDGKEKAFHDETAEPGEMVVADRDGWRTFRVVAGESDQDLRWGSAALKLAIRQPGEEPPDPLVLVDGEFYEAEGGVLELRGLEPGPHRVIVAIRDEVKGGRELRIVLADGETREKTVVLGEE